jgi:hypothetical protein
MLLMFKLIDVKNDSTLISSFCYTPVKSENRFFSKNVNQNA